MRCAKLHADAPTNPKQKHLQCKATKLVRLRIMRPRRRHRGTGAAPRQMQARKRPRAPLQVVTHQLPLATQVVECPVCGRALSLAAVDVHLDSCLSKRGGAGAAPGGVQQPSSGVQRTLAQASGFVALPRGVRAPLSASPAKARASTAPQPPPGLVPPPDRELHFQVDAPVEPAAGGALAAAGASSAHPQLAPQLSSPPAHAQQAVCLPDAVDDDGDASEDTARDCSMEPAVLATFVAGRHAHKAAAPALAPGAAVTLVREPDNAVDAAALKVVTLCGACLGYVPAAVAAELSPLLDAELLQLHATLPAGAAAGADAPSGDAPPMHITATFDAGCASLLGARLGAGWGAAATAAAATLPGGAARTASAVRNMRALVSTVVASASHLFTAEQSAVMEAFTCTSSLSDAAAALLVHMLLRKGPWFKLAALHYAGIDDSLAAVKELQSAGLAHALDPSAPDACIAAVLSCERTEAADAARDLCQLLTAAEARTAVATAQLVTPPSAAARMSRSDAVAALARGLACSDEDDTAHRAALAWATAVTSSKAVVRLTPLAASALARAQRLFFLGCGGSASASAALDISRFLLVDLGVVRYPRVMGTPQLPADGCMWTHLFPTMEHLERFEEAVTCEADLESALEARDDGAAMRTCERSLAALGWRQGGDAAAAHATLADEQQAVRTPFLAQFTAAHIHAGCVTVAVTLHERARDYTAAVALLRRLLSSPHCPGGRGKLWVRLATDLEHTQLYDDALDACEAGLGDAWTRPGQAHELRAKALRIAKPPRRWKPPAWAVSAPHLQPPRVVTVPQPTPLRSERSKKSLFAADANAVDAIEPADGAEQHWTVEQLALAHYRAAGWPCGVHSESQVWTTLFGLMFWDILFDANTAPPGAFLGSPFQTAPLDLHSSHFAAWPPRAAAIRGRLQCIATGGSDAARALLSAAWTANKGAACAGVAWSALSLEQLQEVAACIGGANLAAIMRLLALDYAGWRGGMPDLVLWRPQLQPGEPPAAALLVEVKGVNDALRCNQRAWCDALAQAGVDIEVLHFV